MTIERVRDVLEAEMLWGNDYLSKEIRKASASDLLSDVLTSTKSGAMLLTGLTNAQVIRTAEMVDISAICFVRGKIPQAETLELAKEKAIPLLTTRFSMYRSSGLLYQAGLPNCDDFK